MSGLSNGPIPDPHVPINPQTGGGVKKSRFQIAAKRLEVDESQQSMFGKTFSGSEFMPWTRSSPQWWLVIRLLDDLTLCAQSVVTDLQPFGFRYVGGRDRHASYVPISSLFTHKVCLLLFGCNFKVGPSVWGFKWDWGSGMGLSRIGAGPVWHLWNLGQTLHIEPVRFLCINSWNANSVGGIADYPTTMILVTTRLCTDVP